MGSIFRYLGLGSDADLVLNWFLALPQPPVQVQGLDGPFLYFRALGPIVSSTPGSASPVNFHLSPVVSLFPPEVRRGALYTVGEVHFLSTPLRSVFPTLHAISRQFKKWLSAYPLVFDSSPAYVGEWNYYLEGSIRNFDAPVYALPEGMAALTQGQYFVDHGDTPARLETICRALRLRGVQGLTAG